MGRRGKEEEAKGRGSPSSLVGGQIDRIIGRGRSAPAARSDRVRADRARPGLARRSPPAEAFCASQSPQGAAIAAAAPSLAPLGPRLAPRSQRGIVAAATREPTTGPLCGSSVQFVG